MVEKYLISFAPESVTASIMSQYLKIGAATAPFGILFYINTNRQCRTGDTEPRSLSWLPLISISKTEPSARKHECLKALAEARTESRRKLSCLARPEFVSPVSTAGRYFAF